MKSQLHLYKIVTISLIIIGIHLHSGVSKLNAQHIFDRVPTEVSNLGFSVSNSGHFGRGNTRYQPDGDPSFQFPDGSGTEHMFEGALWIGAKLDGGEIGVSTGAVTGPSGYVTGQPGYEFTNNGSPVIQRSSLPESDFFSPNAVSHQDLIAEFSDRRTTIGNQPIPEHENLLYADVRVESYSWNFGFSEAFTILKYEITNNSHIHIGDGSPESGITWEDVYVGQYTDLAVRNIFTYTGSGGQPYFNKTGFGYIDSLHTVYAFDSGSDDMPRTNTYGGTTMLGASYRDVDDFHPAYMDENHPSGYDVPRVQSAFWDFWAGTGIFFRPQNDVERYERMANEFPLEDMRRRLREGGKDSDGNITQVQSIGPFPEVSPGESFTVYYAYVAGLFPENVRTVLMQTWDIDEHDTPEHRANFKENVEWAIRVFEGQQDEQTGERERFLVPTPPDVPQVRIEADAGTISVFWDNRAEFSVDPVSGEEDFEGYRIYKSRLGDDVRGGEIAPQMVREYDTPGTSTGFGTGFEDIKLEEPHTFPDDDTEYHYRYDFEGLPSGWQYIISVTAFDGDDDGVEPMESSRRANEVHVIPGTQANENFESSNSDNQVGVYPNPYRVNAAWDGQSEFNRKLNFYNLPQQAEIRVYTLAGEIVAQLDHNGASASGTSSTRWHRDFSSENRIVAGGEHSWDLLSDANQALSTGLYLYTVKDKDSGNVQKGKLAIIK